LLNNELLPLSFLSTAILECLILLRACKFRKKLQTLGRKRRTFKSWVNYSGSKKECKMQVADTCYNTHINSSCWFTAFWFDINHRSINFVANSCKFKKLKYFCKNSVYILLKSSIFE
jgi:hypothetical protein